MNRRLRDQLAEWCLAALRDPGAEKPLRALEAFCENSDERGTAATIAVEHAEALGACPSFERVGSALRLRSQETDDLPALRRRVARFSQAVADARGACGSAQTRLAWYLCAAAALFNAGLFFEVHELLEECWRPAQGPARTLLQGLIQVAVGLHHLANENRRGALSVLEEGAAKLRAFVPESHGVELASFCAAIDATLRSLRDGTAGGAPAIPRLTVRQSSTSTR